MVFFLVTLIKRYNHEVRRCLFLVYSLVLILNLIELIAFVVVYLVLFDVIGDLCEDFQVDPPSDDRLKFDSVNACIYNIRLVTIAALISGSLFYFPLKYHLMLVLRAFYKDKRDRRANLISQEEELARTARIQIEMMQSLDRQQTG